MTHANYLGTTPPIESLLEDVKQSMWPFGLSDKSLFEQQLTARRSLLGILRDIFAVLPSGFTLSQGLLDGLLNEDQVVRLCTQLAIQLGQDDAQKRLTLYLPFELLSPNTIGSERMQAASNRLQQSYRTAWEQQLFQHEVRANYVDGDVLEPELRCGDHPRVVKAAHLIPSLLRVGHLTVAEVLEYQRQATDQVLQCSIHDACLVAADLGLFPRDQIVSRSCEEDMIQEDSNGSTPGRSKWLATVAEDKQQFARASEIAKGLLEGDHVATLTLNVRTALQAVRLAATADESVFIRHQEWIESMARSITNASERDELVTLLAHIYALGFASESDLAMCGLTLPNLAGPFADNLSRMQPNSDHVLDTCRQLAEHPGLRELVYPVTLIFGSQIKGYGLTAADCDVAVFVRPGVSREKREYLEQELAQIYSHERIGGKVMLFWLKDTGEQLRVIDWSEPEYSDGESSWLHVLFGALWFGEETSVSLLHENLLVPYFSAPDQLLADKPVYDRWLEEMERDSLQYRLLHKGFGRYYEIQSLMETEHGHLIDGHAAFYDSQYRRIATELFVRRVWLPQL